MQGLLVSLSSQGRVGGWLLLGGFVFLVASVVLIALSLRTGCSCCHATSGVICSAC